MFHSILFFFSLSASAIYEQFAAIYMKKKLFLHNTKFLCSDKNIK